MNDYLGVIAICGEEGSGKTTMGLSFPKPLVHLDIDVGSYARAAWRIDTKDITSKPFPQQLDIKRLLGQEVEKRNGQVSSIRFAKKVEGRRELWQEIVRYFAGAVQDPKVKSIMFDSATLTWITCHRGHLQELQEKQIAQGERDENKLRENLQSKEYGPPNEKMRMLFHTAKSFRKNLIMTHYPRPVYAQRINGRTGEIEDYTTGALTLDGFGETAKIADVVAWTKVVEIVVDAKKKTKMKVIMARLDKCGIPGMGLSCVGKEVEGSYDGLMSLVEGGQEG